MFATNHAQGLYRGIEKYGGGSIRELTLRREAGGISHGTFVAARQELCSGSSPLSASRASRITSSSIRYWPRSSSPGRRPSTRPGQKPSGAPSRQPRSQGWRGNLQNQIMVRTNLAIRRNLPHSFYYNRKESGWNEQVHPHSSVQLM